MRNIMFKDYTSISSRKKDVLLREVFERNGVIAKSERRCFYYIKNTTPVNNGEDIEKWLEGQEEPGCGKRRHFHIMKEHNDGSNEDRLSCKIAGTFYAVVNKTVYTIGFMHYFKVRFAKVILAK